MSGLRRSSSRHHHTKTNAFRWYRGGAIPPLCHTRMSQAESFAHHVRVYSTQELESLTKVLVLKIALLLTVLLRVYWGQMFENVCVCVCFLRLLPASQDQDHFLTSITVAKIVAIVAPDLK